MTSGHIEHMTLSVRAAKDSMLMTRAGNIRLACFDVDGTLTDGRLFFDSEGREIKAFHVHDGQGLVLLREVGITVALITVITLFRDQIASIFNTTTNTLSNAGS